ncbi:hypothetical protein QTP70_013275 [Hemibagrus guttatus]|uniref:Uncharacterized protein n=1 Tax=Hemibagrus guttatus TaxID=175788 RepID=A0AAE0QSP9_9TELE|nr:hypothetical protein QTP70_013275 [Hemibagrus guttatus]
MGRCPPQEHERSEIRDEQKYKKKFGSGALAETLLRRLHSHLMRMWLVLFASGFSTCLGGSEGHEEEDVLKGRKSFRGHTVASQSPEAELMLEGEDDGISLLQDKDMDNLAEVESSKFSLDLTAALLRPAGQLTEFSSQPSVFRQVYVCFLYVFFVCGSECMCLMYMCFLYAVVYVCFLYVFFVCGMSDP